MNLRNKQGQLIQKNEFLLKMSNKENSQILDKSFRKSTVAFKNEKGRQIRVYSTPPILIGNTFLRQKI